MKIKNFLKAFKLAYNEINKEKYEAKKYLKEVKEWQNIWEKMYKNTTDIVHLMRDSWSFFPTTLRQDSMQKVMDLFNYGTGLKIKNKCGLINVYLYFLKDTQNTYYNMMSVYNEHDYEAVRTYYNEYISYICRYMNNYNIEKNNKWPTMPIEKTCTCVNDLLYNDYTFRKGKEYQVDIYPEFYKIYNNGGWNDYIFVKDDKKFNENFKLID